MILEEQNGKLVYSDGGSVEEQMLAIAQRFPESASAEAIAEDSRYTVNNTFSPVRRNLLNWYHFKPDADILEVGAGMGSMTGLLCDVAGSVTSVEMNERRAEVIRARYPKRKNLTVLSTDVTTWQTSRRFDYIVVVGVLEYAGVFAQGTGSDPYIFFLKALGNLLAPGGVLLLAIENRFGLKYWLGAAEDHLQEAFTGIAGYQKTGTPKTFSQAELEGLFSCAGFATRRYYYTLPDYKFPTAVFTDDALPSVQDLLNIGFTYSKGTRLVADEKDLYADVLANGLFPNMANSYLIEATVKDALPTQRVVRVSARGECRPEYRIVTTIDSDGRVAKRAADARAAQHVQNTYENGEALRARGVGHIPGSLEDGALITRIEHAPMANEVFCAALNRGDWPTANKMITLLEEALTKASETTSEANPLLAECGIATAAAGPLLRDGYIDMTLYNAFYEDDALVFFDQEWRFDGIPLRFLLYYALKITFGRNDGVSQIPFSEVLRRIGVSEEEAPLWDALEERLWQTVLARTGDVYGEDGYCNRYSNELTLAYGDEQHKAECARLEDARCALEEELRVKEIALQDAVDALLLDELKEREREAEWRVREEETLAILAENRSYKQVVENSEARLYEQAAQINHYIGHIGELSAAHDHLVLQRDELERIRASRTFRYASKFTRGVRRVFPVGTRRSRVLGALLRWPVWLVRAFRKTPALPTVSTPALEAPVQSPALPEVVTEAATRYEKLRLPEYEQPVVSIVIPVYNEFAYTYACIKSIVETSGALRYEVLLADDASSDETKDIAALMPGLRVIRNAENLRFLRNCNHAAEAARGNYIVFLNNDTLVHEGWLQNLLALMEADDAVGIVGSKLVYADGTLQEAGGIIWADGSAWNFGHGQNPEASEYNYVKEVDYISGCSLMIRASLWRDIGGFDERFAPAYCEDSDLAFEVRKRGYKVLYQPFSVITHFEGVTNGTDLSTGQKQYQAKNQATFREKWSEELASGQFPCGTHVLRARERAKGKKTMLLVDHYVPTYDCDAGSRTLDDYIRLLLAHGWHITFLPDNFNRSEPYTERYQRLGMEVLYGPGYRDGWQKWVIENGVDIDVVFLNRPHIAVHYIDFMRENTNAKILYYGMDLHFLREQREYELTGNVELPLVIEKHKKAEIVLMKKSDCALYPSFEETAYIRKLDPSIRVMTMPAYIYPPEVHAPYTVAGREGLLFVGGFTHTPNVDAVLWFVREVLPAIAQQLPAVQLHIVGSNTPPEVDALAGPGVCVHGFVSNEELFRLYDSCRLAVVPLRYGAGIKGKVVEAMAKGLPVATTAIGAEGLLDANDYLAVEDTAEDFAARVVTLYDDEAALAALSSKAHVALEAQFSEDAAISLIDKALSGTAI